jgi:hypothetical protein
LSSFVGHFHATDGVSQGICHLSLLSGSALINVLPRELLSHFHLNRAKPFLPRITRIFAKNF